MDLACTSVRLSGVEARLHLPYIAHYWVKQVHFDFAQSDRLRVIRAHNAVSSLNLDSL